MLGSVFKRWGFQGKGVSVIDKTKDDLIYYTTPR